MAILLVETCALRLSDRPGGIPVDNFKETPGILEQVMQNLLNILIQFRAGFNHLYHRETCCKLFQPK